MYYLFLAITIFASNRVDCQAISKFKLGLKGGLNLSKFKEKNVNNSFLPLYSIGVITEYRLSQQATFSLEASYSRQGNLLHIINPGLYDRVRTRYNYLTIPIGLKFKLGNELVSILPGIRTSFLLDDKVEFLPINGHTNSNQQTLRKNDLGFFLGIGLNLSKKLIIETQYYQSLNTIYRSVHGIDPFTGSVIIIQPNQIYNQIVSFDIKFFLINHNSSK